MPPASPRLSPVGRPAVTTWDQEFARAAHRARETRTFAGRRGNEIHHESTDGLPGETVHHVKSGTFWNTEASVSVELGCGTLGLLVATFTLWRPREPRSLGVLVTSSSHGHGQFAAPHSAGRGCMFPASRLGLVFLVSCPHTGAHLEPPH